MPTDTLQRSLYKYICCTVYIHTFIGSRKINDLGSGRRGKRKASAKATPFTKAKKPYGNCIDVDADAAPVLGRGFALDPIVLEGKKVCGCDIDDILDLDFKGSRFVARVTKFELYKSSKSSNGSISSKDGQLLIYLKVSNIFTVDTLLVFIIQYVPYRPI